MELVVNKSEKSLTFHLNLTVRNSIVFFKLPLELVLITLHIVSDREEKCQTE